MPATLLKKRLSHRCFPTNFAKFLYFFTEHLKTTASDFSSETFMHELKSPLPSYRVFHLGHVKALWTTLTKAYSKQLNYCVSLIRKEKRPISIILKYVT